MVVGDAHVFPGFLTPVSTQLFFPKPQTTFLTNFCRGERPKYAGKKVHLNRGLNTQPLGHESDTLNTEPPGRAYQYVLFFQKVLPLQFLGSHAVAKPRGSFVFYDIKTS